MASTLGDNSDRSATAPSDESLVNQVLGSDLIDSNSFDAIKKCIENLAVFELRHIRCEDICGRYYRFVRHLGKEIASLRRFDLTYPIISRAAFELIIFLLQSSWKLCSVLRELCLTRPSNKKNLKSLTSLGIETFEELSGLLEESANEFYRQCSEATGLLSQGTDLDAGTAERVKGGKLLDTIPDRISAATFRELLVLNEIYHQRSRFLSPHQSKSDILKEILNKLKQDTKKLNKDEPTWAPRMIAIVLDTKTRVLYTGSTQCGCETLIPDFKASTMEINLQRLGNAFRDVVDTCKQDFNTVVGRLKSREPDFADIEDDQIDSEYDQFVADAKPAEYDELPRPRDGDQILCWAVDGYSFEYNPPCPRCQRFFNRWTLYDSPQDSVAKKEVLTGMRQQRGPSCCAETVAAGKIYSFTAAN